MSFARFVKVNQLAAVALLTVGMASCNRGPAAITGPSISPSGAGSKAMELYDKDGDGKIAGAELDATPALKATMSTLDTNGDKAVDAGEVAARVKAWQATGIGLTGFRVKLTLDGQPLAGAEVLLEPDPCLGDDIKAAKSTSGAYGDASLVIPPENRPTPNSPGGVQLGMYVIRITKSVNGKETIPARYNSRSTLGQQVAYDEPTTANPMVTIALKSAP